MIGPAEDAKVLEATIRELLARLQLTMATEKTAPSGSLLETVVIDLTGTYGTKVVVKNASGKTVLDRTIEHSDSAAIHREQIAHAVRGAAEAEILEDDDRVAGRAPPIVEPPAAPVSTMQPLAPAPTVSGPPPPAPPPPTVVTTVVNPPDKAEERPKAPSSLALEVATFAGGGFFASETLAMRVGGGLTLASRKWLRPSISVTALYAFPFQNTLRQDGQDTLTSRTNLLSIRALPGLGVWRSKRFGVDVAAGAGIDMLDVSSSSGPLPSSALAASTLRADFVMTGVVSGYWAIASDVALTVSAVFDVDPSSRTYVFADRGTDERVLAPWNLRPMLLAGLSFTALGGGR